MGFFDELRRSAPDVQEDDEEEYESPAWIRAPEDQLAGVVPAELLLARTDQAAIYVGRLAAYDCGFSFELHLHTRKQHDYDGLELVHRAQMRPKDPPPDELVRLGIELADGRRASNLGGVIGGATVGMFMGEEERQPDPATDLVLISGGGSGSLRHTQADYWVWPLPPEGPLRFVCAWPLFDIPESATEIDAALILDPSRRARRIWEG